MNIRDFVNDYEFRGDGGDYTPNEHEKILIEDAISEWVARQETGGNESNDA